MHSDDGKKTFLSLTCAGFCNLKKSQPPSFFTAASLISRQAANLLQLAKQQHWYGEIPNASDTAELPTPMRPAYSCVQYNQEPSPPHRNIKLDTIIFFAYAKVKPNQHDAEERRIIQPVYPILDSLAQSDGSSIPA